MTVLTFEVIMDFYSNYVNYSVFDGEITLTNQISQQLISLFFQNNISCKQDIVLNLNNKAFNAYFLKLNDRNYVQIKYNDEDIKNELKTFFSYSYDYWHEARKQASALGISTRQLPKQKIEKILIESTDDPLVFDIKKESIYNNDHPFDKTYLDPDDLIFFSEGSQLYKTHITYERNRALVNLAKKQFKISHNGKLFCEVCGFSFDKYGARGENYIEAHHDLIPVHQMGSNYQSKISDLRMVCSNCHKMLHLRHPWLSVNQLTKIIKKHNIT